ncbi:MAG: hypothetical protein LKM43_01515 [Wolbachia endosymbiont of Penenirmus auritus]|nr:hypothetical protein [Wolbachia endosymbiont of Penenirmus auritus]
MYADYIKDLEALREIISEFIKYSDKYNQSIGDEQDPALNLYKTEIDLIGLEQITREFVNDLGNISEKEVLKHEECIITLPEKKQLVENLRKLEEKISDFIQFVHHFTQSVDDNQLIRQYAALSLSYGGKDLMALAKITHELFSEKDDFEFVDKGKLPSTEVQNTSYIGKVFNHLGLA